MKRSLVHALNPLKLLHGRELAHEDLNPVDHFPLSHCCTRSIQTPLYRDAPGAPQMGGFRTLPGPPPRPRRVLPSALCAALALAGCRADFEIPQQEQPAPVVVDDAPKCFVRARFFRGLVQTPCADIVREVRP